MMSEVWGCELGLLRPSPAGSQEQTLVFAATAGWTLAQLTLQPLPPAVSRTTGPPWPMHTRWIVRPSGRREESLVLA